MCSMCVQVPLEAFSGPLELELQRLVLCSMWVSNPRSSVRQEALLTAELSLQPLSSVPVFFIISLVLPSYLGFPTPILKGNSNDIFIMAVDPGLNVQNQFYLFR